MKWWRVFIDKLSGNRSEPDGTTPRRRKAERFEFETTVTARCSSWPKFVNLFTGDVSAGGLFVPTTESAEIGEEIEVDLALPDKTTLRITGKVVNIIGEELASKRGKPPGLGIMLDPLEGEAKERFEQVLRAARASAPQPPKPTITPADAIQTSAVREAVAAGSSVARLTEEDFSPKRAAPPPPKPPPTPTPAAAKAKKPPPPPPPVKKRRSEPVIGMDLGTSYTSVAAVVDRKVKILPWPDGIKSSPSVVAFPSEHEVLVGVEARKRLASDPKHTVTSPKRLLGRKYEDKEIQGYIGQAPFRTLEGPNSTVVLEIWRQQFAVPQLCSYLIEDARRVAEQALGQRIEKCVMTVPVSFDDDRAKLLRRAAEMAQLEVLALIDEPSAAALANRFEEGFGGVVGVYDFGGGTFDFSLVDVSGGDFQVLATAGDTWLGGDDFDQVLADAAANQFWRMHNVDLHTQSVEWQRLVWACERAKRLLSVDEKSAIFVPEVMRGAEGMIDLHISLDRPTFERACAPVIARSLATCDDALELLDMKPTELTAVYLSGGTTYVPAVREAIANHFQVPVRTGVPPEHAVCLGAAIHAAQLQFAMERTTLEARDA